jgi:hypothetical protein
VVWQCLIDIFQMEDNAVICMSVTVEGVWDWILDSLTTLIPDLRLHLIIVPSQISTIYTSLEDKNSVLSLLTVSTRPLLVAASNNG